ncbi:MAG: hypothetical protein GY854_33690 [Deltaproteobacteria bacterium]|nr:hypothetical protein [Deltaproteobacteria bacterium]
MKNVLKIAFAKYRLHLWLIWVYFFQNAVVTIYIAQKMGVEKGALASGDVGNTLFIKILTSMAIFELVLIFVLNRFLLPWRIKRKGVRRGAAGSTIWAILITAFNCAMAFGIAVYGTIAAVQMNNSNYSYHFVALSLIAFVFSMPMMMKYGREDISIY